jgi:bacteriochlorophyll C8 methyltransferase
MRVLILGENCLLRLTSFDKSIFTTFSFISSIYARQLAAVTPKKHIVRVLEGSEDIDFDEECDVVHIHFKTGTALRAYEFADEFRKRGKTVVLSGSHPSALPEESKHHADSVIVGSAEILWPEVLKDL